MQSSFSFIYPSSLDSLSGPAQLFRIARHSKCFACSCEGLHPQEGWIAQTEDSVNPIALLELDGPLTDDGYLRFCACGHGWEDHGAGSEVGHEELKRRARVAYRIDELLEDSGRLLDFSYVDEDILSLRRQMTIPSEDHGHDNAYSPSPSSPASSSSSLSDAPLAPNKRRRISTSSLSDAEENMPLAARNSDYGHVRNHDQWTSGQKTVPQPGPHGLPSEYSRTEPMHNSSGTIKEVRLKIKVEDMKTDTAQLAQLAQGVAVDPVFTPVEPSARREKPAVIEERNGIIRFVVVKNDGSPTSNILLTGLKVLFQKQLPKMPREYITRLVFDRSSQGMAIVHRGLKVVGGITFRPFPHRSFSEIVFLAISSSFQVNGYGGHLMNKYKAYIRSEMPTILHFLTYADNYAIGYFRKQGFTKDITIPRPLWVGYIKDYEGGTLMQCSMLPKVDYLAVPEILARQKEAIVAKIRSRSSRSDIVYRGLNQFKTAPPGFQMDSRDVPGLKESGWTPEMDDASSRPSRGPQHNVMQRLLAELQAHPSGWAFHEPVSREDVPDYFDVIRKPMDFSTMERKLENNMYATLDDFVEDAKLVFSNCRAYNGDNTYARNASRVEKAMQDWLKDWGAQS